jgi:hypothetical protein
VDRISFGPLGILTASPPALRRAALQSGHTAPFEKRTKTDSLAEMERSDH